MPTRYFTNTFKETTLHGHLLKRVETLHPPQQARSFEDVPGEEGQSLPSWEGLLALRNLIPLDFFASLSHLCVLKNVILKVYNTFLCAVVGALVCCNLVHQTRSRARAIIM